MGGRFHSLLPIFLFLISHNKSGLSFEINTPELVAGLQLPKNRCLPYSKTSIRLCDVFISSFTAA